MTIPSSSSNWLSYSKRLAAFVFFAVVSVVVVAWLAPLASTVSINIRSALTARRVAPPVPAQSQTSTFYFHGTGPVNNPPTLFLNTTAPTATNEKYKDSTAISRNNGNPWKEVGTWPATAAMTAGTLTSFSDLHVWLGLKNSDDQGTFFDLRVEAYKNGALLTSGQSLCITGITRNANQAKEVVVGFDPFSAATFNGASDVLSLKVLTRVGTNANGSSCGGHSNAVGLRLCNRTEVARHVVRDTTAPVIAIQQPADGAITNATHVIVSGTYADANPVNITINGVVATLSPGTFSANVPLKEGSNTLNAVAADPAGNQSTSSVAVARDTTAPVLTISQPAEGAVVTTSAVTISGTFSDPNKSILTINNDLDNLPRISGNEYTAILSLAEGTKTFTLRGFDKAGNHTDVVRTIFYQIDHTPPQLTVAEPAQNSVVKSLNVKGTITSINPPVGVSANGHPMSVNPDGTFAGALNVPEGVHEIQIQAVDANANTTTIVRNVTIDTTAPAITALSPAAGTLIDSTSVTIQGRITDATTTQAAINGIDATVGADGLFNAQNVPINEGQTEFLITASDAAGNTTRTTLLLVGKDRTAPPAPEVFEVITPTRLNFRTIEGRAEPGAQVLIAGGPQPVTVEAAFGTGLFASPVNLAPGGNLLTITAQDSTGNASTSVQVSITSTPGMAPPPGQPAQINISTGNAQRGLVDTELPRPMIAIVTDHAGAPVAGVAVHFAVKQGGGRFVGGNDNVDALTDAQGQASVLSAAHSLDFNWFAPAAPAMPQHQPHSRPKH